MERVGRGRRSPRTSSTCTSPTSAASCATPVASGANRTVRGVGYALKEGVAPGGPGGRARGARPQLRRPWPPSRWRGAVLASLAIGLLAAVASLTAFLVVRESLRGTLQGALDADAVRVADPVPARAPPAAPATSSPGRPGASSCSSTTRSASCSSPAIRASRRPDALPCPREALVGAREPAAAPGAVSWPIDPSKSRCGPSSSASSRWWPTRPSSAKRSPGSRGRSVGPPGADRGSPPWLAPRSPSRSCGRSGGWRGRPRGWVPTTSSRSPTSVRATRSVA